ncbi:MAG: HI0074 family nucleotidyltransferase substrate-binding subunit [Desulfobacteraceae bacterium]
MEGRLNYKLVQLQDALDNFEKSLSIDLNSLEETLVDSIKSGRVQKFEFCVELVWKTLKVYLWEINGIDSNSPKSVIKDFYGLDLLSVEDYEKLMEAVDDRNRLSHIYSKDQFEDIYNRAIMVLPLLRQVLKNMKQ